MSKELNELFLIQCKQCGSTNVDTAHEEDFTYEDIVFIYCKDCGNEVEL